MALLMSCSMDINGGRSNSKAVTQGDISKSTVKKSINIAAFSKIEASSGIQVIFTQGKFTGTAEVQMTPTAEKYFKIEVADGVLELSYQDNRKEKINGPTIVKVQAPELTSIDLSSASNVTVNGNLKVGNKLDIDLSSASSVTASDISGIKIDIDLSSASSVNLGNLNLNKLDIEQSSSSECVIGKVTAVNMGVDLSSAAKCVISGFNGTLIDTEASSGSSIKIAGIVAETVKAEASSGAGITLQGESGKAFVESSSGGSVDTRQLKTNVSSVKNTTESSSSPTSSGMTMPREP